MKHIFVTNQVYGYDGASNNTVLTLDNINLLNKGGMAIFNHSTGAIVTGGTSLGATPGQTYHFAVGNSTDGTVKPDIITIQWDKVKRITSKVASAPVAKIMAFGDAVKPVSFTPAADKTYTIVIENRNKSIHQTDRKRYYTTIGRTGDTVITVLNRLIAKINSDSLQTVTAALFNTDDGIKFTGTTANNYGVFVMDDLVGAGCVIEAAKADLTGAIIDGTYYDANTSITLATKYGNATLDGGSPDIGYAMWDNGFGTYAQVKELVEEFSSHKGDTKSTYRTTSFYNANTNLESGATYKVYDIEFSGGASNSPVQAESFTQHLMIAAKTGIAIITSLDSMLESVPEEVKDTLDSIDGTIDEMQGDITVLQGA